MRVSTVTVNSKHMNALLVSIRDYTNSIQKNRDASVHDTSYALSH